LIGAAITIVSLVPLVLLGVVLEDPAYLAAWIVILLVCIPMSSQIGRLLTYFSPPSWLTLGYKIGGFAPTSCEVSRLIDGPDSWPCQALRFKAWFFCLGDRECRSLPESDWVTYFYVATCLLYTIILAAYYPRHLALQEDREERARRRTRRVHGVEWDIERDVARGIVRGYRGIARGIARGNTEWGAGARSMNVRTGLQ
jgi:hypothetical protein